MSTTPTVINLVDSETVKVSGDNANPRNTTFDVPPASATTRGSMMNTGDLFGTGDDPGVGGIMGTRIEAPPSEDRQVPYYSVSTDVADAGFALATIKFDHLIGGIDARTTAAETITQDSFANLVTFADTSPAAPIAVSLDATNMTAHFLCSVQNQSSQTITFTPTSGQINDGTGLASTATLPAGSSCAIYFDGTDCAMLAAGAGGGGSGTVTSVALTMPAEFSVAGSPVTSSGTLAVTKANQSANQVYAGPTTGGAAAPAFRALVAADIPNIAESQVTNLTTDLAAKLTNPLTTKGDIIVADTGGTPTRVPPSSTVGLVLTSNGSAAAPSYQSVGTIALPLWQQYHPDSYPSSADAMDDEFEAGSVNTSLWTAVNSAASTVFTQSRGRLIATCSSDNGAAFRGYYQPLPSSGSWEIQSKMINDPSTLSSQYQFIGLMIYESATGKADIFYFGRNADNSYQLKLDKWTSSGGAFGSGIFSATLLQSDVYLSVAYDGSSLYTFKASGNGIAFLQQTSSRTATTDFTTKADRIAVVSYSSGGNEKKYFEWFRRIS